MSYVYELNDDARTNLRQLDPWVAEQVLDELETLVAVQSEERPRTTGGFVYDFIRDTNQQRIYIFLTVEHDPARNLLRITSIGSWSRPIG